VHKAYYSSVLDQPANHVWSLVRDFNAYPRYIEGVKESIIEDGRRGDEIGAVRRFHYGDAWIRQRLTGHSDAERTFSYAGMEPFEFPTKDGPAPINYQGTLRLMPIIDGDRTFIEWSVEFGSNSNDSGQWMALLQELIPLWVDSLRRTLAGATLK
jgi:Polyketide cyclase / dehydrase and lipid transport